MIRRFEDGRDRFFEKRFGMFIHWGLYSIPAWHEQIIWRSRMPRRDYEKLASQFNPEKFDPDAWLDLAEKAGMEYICFTTKHHDGFCMWDTQHTKYNITNTPYGRDILGILAEACKRRGILLSLYYSLPDWHHPNYPNQGRHHEMFGPRAGDEPDGQRYLQFVRNQVRELCTNYGPIYQFFWDVNVAEFYDPGINDMIRTLQPGILINDRGPGSGDYFTPERDVPEGREFQKPTEACQALGSESWGYKEDEDYHSDKFIMQSIDKILAMGGNYLLNAGPKADGTFCDENVSSLFRIGKWYSCIKESIIDTVPASAMIDTEDVLLTRKGNCIYAHLYKDPVKSSIVLKPLDILPAKAVLLNNGTELEACVDITPALWREKPYLRIRNLPINDCSDTVMVVKLIFAETVNQEDANCFIC